VGICAGVLWDFFLYYFRHWQMGNGRRVGKGRVSKVEEEAGNGKRRNESQCERGYMGRRRRVQWEFYLLF